MQINHLIIQECAKLETKCGFETTKKKLQNNGRKTI